MFNQHTPKDMASERTYIGNGKQKAGSEYIRLSLCVEDLLSASHAEAVEHSNGKHYITVVVARKRTSDHGNTHTAYVPHRPDPELAYHAIADRQELEVRDHDARNS